MFSHLYQKKLYTIFQPTFSRSKRYQDILFKLHILSTYYVTKKIIVVRTTYFYISCPIFAAKKCDRDCTQSKKLYGDILASLDREKLWAGKKYITFLVKMKQKHGEISSYFCLNIVVERSRTFSVQYILTETT